MSTRQISFLMKELCGVGASAGIPVGLCHMKYKSVYWITSADCPWLTRNSCTVLASDRVRCCGGRGEVNRKENTYLEKYQEAVSKVSCCHVSRRRSDGRRTLLHSGDLSSHGWGDCIGFRKEIFLQGAHREEVELLLRHCISAIMHADMVFRASAPPVWLLASANMCVQPTVIASCSYWRTNCFSSLAADSTQHIHCRRGQKDADRIQTCNFALSKTQWAFYSVEMHSLKRAGLFQKVQSRKDLLCLTDATLLSSAKSSWTASI